MHCFDIVEKQIKNPQEAEMEMAKTDQKEQKEEEEYEPMTGAAFNVTTNANRLVPIRPGYRRDLNTSNRHYNSAYDRYRERYENEQQDSAHATSRNARRRESRRRLPSEDRR